MGRSVICITFWGAIARQHLLSFPRPETCIDILLNTPGLLILNISREGGWQTSGKLGEAWRLLQLSRARLPDQFFNRTLNVFVCEQSWLDLVQLLRSGLSHVIGWRGQF